VLDAASTAALYGQHYLNTVSLYVPLIMPLEIQTSGRSCWCGKRRWYSAVFDGHRFESCWIGAGLRA